MPLSTIDEVVLPSAPLKVKLEDLSPEGKLLTKEQITQAIVTIQDATHLQKESARRFKKSELNTPYDILVFDQEYYAIYYGAKRNAHLGVGGFGYVKLAQNLQTGAWAVLKLVPNQAKNEYLVLQKLELALGYLERNLSGFKENSFIEFQKKQHQHGMGTWYSSHQTNLLMQLADGVSLAEISQNNHVLSANQWLEIIVQVLKAYKNIKDKHIIHKDLKLENIFYSFSKNKATIIDFGASKKKELFSRRSKKDIVYSIGYTAPEIGKKGLYGEASDIYALGATFIYLLRLQDSNQSPIKEAHLFATLNSYCLTSMIHQSAKKRPSVEEAIQFFEMVQHSLSNIVPKPFRKIALFSVDEYLHYLNEAKMSEENKISATETLNDTLKNEQEIVASEQQEPLYVANLLFNGLARLRTYFLPTNPGIPLVTPKEEKDEPIPAKEAAKRYDHAFISALKLCDEVWLIDTAKRTPKEYIQLRRELEAQQIVVGDRCFLFDSNQLNNAIPDLLEKLGNERSNKYFWVTAQAEMPLPENICPLILQPEENETYYQEKIDTYTALDVQKEYQHIKNSLAVLADQYDFVKNKLVEFDKQFAEGKLSLEYLKSSLAGLSKKLATAEHNKATIGSSTHSHLAFFPNLTHKKSPDKQILEQVDSQIGEWLSSYQR